MIYSVHFNYHKAYSRKPASKCELLIFASSEERAEELAQSMISEFNVVVEHFHTINLGIDKEIEQIYDERPELRGISPEKGYIYNEYMNKTHIQKYLK